MSDLTGVNGNIFPDYLMIRDTQLHDDMGGGGQRIYTTAGRGYEKVKYVRADLVPKPIKSTEVEPNPSIQGRKEG